MGAVISKLLFQPPDPPSYKDNGDIIWLKTKEGVEIPSILLPYDGSDVVLIYSHGNATDLGQMIPYLELLRSRLKVNVFSYEYQGYGISKPKVKCTEKRCYSSIEAAVTFLSTKKKFPTENIIVFGCSLGSGPTIHITSKKAKFRAVILQSAFTSVIRIKFNTKKALPIDMFQNIDLISGVKCPVFFIHGKSDEVVPFLHGQKLCSMVEHKYDPLWIDYAGHNNIMEVLGVDLYIKRIRKFINYTKNYHNKTKDLQKSSSKREDNETNNGSSSKNV